MTEATAIALLKKMTQFDVAPVLTAGSATSDIETLVSLARRVDRDGREIDDADWIGTYDLNWAAAEGWMWKAGKVANTKDISMDNLSVKHSQVGAQCLERAQYYRRKIVGSFAVKGSLAV